MICILMTLASLCLMSLPLMTMGAVMDRVADSHLHFSVYQSFFYSKKVLVRLVIALSLCFDFLY